MDELEEERGIENVRLILPTVAEVEDVVEILQIPLETWVIDRPPTFIDGGDDGVHVLYPESDDHGEKIPVEPDTTPWIRLRIFGGGVDYELHPSLLRRKRRRKRAYL